MATEMVWHQRQSESPLLKGIRVLYRNPMTLAGMAIILIWSVAAVFAPVLAPYDALDQNIPGRLQPPSRLHLCGTDELGRDVFSRIIHGARISLPMGLIVVLFAIVLGGAIGALAGFLGGLFDDLVMRLADITLAFPSIVLALAIASAMGPSLKNLLIAMMAVWWPEYARLMRGQVLSVKTSEYVAACRVIGASPGRILLRHIVPNAGIPLIVKASLDAGSAILTVAALSFIGLGAVPPTPEWGAMISIGRTKFYQWWMMTFPGLAILSVVLGFNFLGDGLRDALDPRLRGE